jgi:DNA polymerase III delta prime subunit
MADAARERLMAALRSGRVHGAYLFAGPGEAPRRAAEWFVRALACNGDPTRTELPCEECAACRRSRAAGEPLALDGDGKSGPLFRHVGEHPDLLWVERGDERTRVTIKQVRALQDVFRLKATTAGRRAAVIADAEWLNQEAQNALLRTIEEPPPHSTFVLVCASPAGLLATVRSRCVRVDFPRERTPSPTGADAPEAVRALAQRIAAAQRLSLPALLDWAEEFRGPRAIAAAQVNELLAVGSAWLHEEITRAAEQRRDRAGALGAFAALAECRKALAQRNANPQMVAERALLSLREALA